MASLDISLDDMIKKSKTNNRKGGRPSRVRGQGGSFSAPRKNPLGVNVSPSASNIAKSVSRTRKAFWQTDLVEDGLKAAGLSGVERDTKLYVSNLDSGVTNDDIRDLFSEFGGLIRYGVHYDRNGRPSVERMMRRLFSCSCADVPVIGSAELIFARRSNAFQALKRYNNVQLDGKPMKIEIVGANAAIPLSDRVNVFGGANGNKRTVVRGSGAFQSRSGFTSVNRGFGKRGCSNIGRGRDGGGRGGHARAQQNFKRKNVEKSADELDKELETYHAEAMQS